MNRYLAVCHAFALLETPVSGTEFSQAVVNNPLFTAGCARPQLWLDWLSEEGLLTEQELTYCFSPVGEQMYRHVLNWTARDKQAVAERTASRRAQTATPPISPECPACGSDFCANYLSVILLENFNADRARWQADETDLLNAVLADFQSRHPAARLYLLADTQPQDLAPDSAQALAQTTLSQAADFGLTPEALQTVFSQRQTLPEISSVEHVRVPRLRYELGLMPQDSLTALRRIAYPTLFTDSPAGQPESWLLRVTQPAFSLNRHLALIGLSAGPQTQNLIFRLSAEGAWQTVS